MAQVIVYGASDSIHRNCGRLSDAIHGAVMAALAYPPEKRFRRFTALEPDDFVHPDDRGDDYTSIQVSMFAGRSDGAKRRLIQELFDWVEEEVGIAPHSVELTITEAPKVNWDIRGRNAEDLAPGYTVQVKSVAAPLGREG